MHQGMGKKWLMELILLISVYIYQLMSKVQLPGSFRFDSHIRMHTGTENKDVSLAQEFKDNLEEEHRQNGAIYQGKKRDSWKGNGRK